MIQTQGQQANLNGHIFEDMIEGRFKLSKYKEVPKKDFFDYKLKFPDEKIYSRQLYLCDGIYGTPYKADFIIYNKEKYPDCLAFEFRWQSCPGSVDQKYPYTVSCIKEKFPCLGAIIIGGTGCRSSVINWLKNQVDAKFIAVFLAEEFFKWADEGGL